MNLPQPGPLAGVRIIEIAHMLAGPYCGMLLADLGAEVIKIEPPSGDPLRWWGPFPGGVPDPNRSGSRSRTDPKADPEPNSGLKKKI